MNDIERECPECGSKNIEVLSATDTFEGTLYLLKCRDCGCEFSFEVLK